MDRGNIVIMIAINLIAGVVLYQRLHSMGHVPSLKEMLHHYGESLFPPSPHMRPACGFVNATKLVISSKRVVLEKGVAPASIVIINGKIESIRDKPPSDKYYTLIDYGDAVISPGVIDVHAHFNEPGREDWEGITTGTSAAAAGGITTVIDMPLNSHPCTTNVKLLREKMSVAKAKAHVNMGFWGGITPENANGDHQDLAAMIDAGALGFKSFMSPSGIDDFVNVVKNDISLVLPWLMRNAVPYLLHCELVAPVKVPLEPENKYVTYMNTRPPAFEQQAIHDLIAAMVESGKKAQAKEGFHVHIVHLADADSIHMVKLAKKKLRLTVETCAHYLTFASEDIPDGATEYKCAPPIRGAANREKLIQGVTDGIIDLISSDHSPAPPSMKQRESGDFLKAWGGISGIQYLLPATWSALSQHNMTDLKELAQLLSASPAALANLQDRKGTIKPGMDADFVVWDPDQPADTSEEGNMHKHKLSPYTGRELWGKVLATFVGGSQVYRSDVGMHKDVCGSLVLRRKTFVK